YLPGDGTVGFQSRRPGQSPARGLRAPARDAATVAEPVAGGRALAGVRAAPDRIERGCPHQTLCDAGGTPLPGGAPGSILDRDVCSPRTARRPAGTGLRLFAAARRALGGGGGAAVSHAVGGRSWRAAVGTRSVARWGTPVAWKLVPGGTLSQ